MNTEKSQKLMLLVRAAMIAALYVVLTFIANAMGIASQVIQIRFSGRSQFCLTSPLPQYQDFL